MKVGAIQTIIPKLTELKSLSEKNVEEFGSIITSLVEKVNQDQITSANLTNDFTEGKEIELHDVMIAGEKAKTSLELLMEIRNKALDMYRELTRMPI
jgi:flagellar hook-basal body complex protein FliE